MAEARVDDQAARDADAALADLWARYVAGRDGGLRDRLILHYAPWSSTWPGGSAPASPRTWSRPTWSPTARSA
ncbi:hypothetical protein ACFQX8_13750 [Klenkia terrae]|uniref:hypothetical protein n=1 Tax=Klenkia terrae TaxID=1052259 RepID=UPI00361A66F7